MSPERRDKRGNLGTGAMFLVVGGIVALLIWVAQLVFMAWFAVEEPESVPEAEDVVENAPGEERGGSPGGGDLTSTPTQTMPEEDRVPPEEAPQPDE